MTDLTTRRVLDGPEPEDRPEPEAPRLVDPPSVFPDGVPLRRLLARAQLTVPQAVELASGVAAEAARRFPRGSAGAFRVGADGRVVPGPPARGGDEGEDVAAVLAEIAEGVRPRAAGPPGDQLLAALDRAVAELPEVGLPAAARTLREAAGALDRGRVRAQLGALVRAVGTDPAPPPAAGHPRGDVGRPGGDAAARTWTAPTGRARTTRRRIGAWLLSLLVLGGVVVLEVGFLRDHIAADVGLLLDAGHGNSAPSSSTPTPDGVPVARPAPAAAGAVTGVDLRALAPCAPGAACTVRVAVTLAPGVQQQVVAWTYRIVDRCTGAPRSVPGGTLTVPAGARQAAVVGAVPLPAGNGLALIAVTRRPAVAASPPVLVGSCSARTSAQP